MGQAHHWGQSKGFRHVARLELPGAEQVVVEGNYAYIGHMKPPEGTSIVDISDPKHPKVVAQLEIAPNLHSHKVRVHDNVMLVNHEKYRGYRGDDNARGGLKVFDISNRSAPREIAFVEAGEWGCHRFTFDGRYCYGSPNPEGYVGNIMEILDLQNPEKPEVVSHWWVPGQWEAGGEPPHPDGRRVRCHHPMRLGDRLYCTWWHHGWYIFDISDRARPEDQPFDPECWYGCHQSQEQLYDNHLAVTWFGGGLRMIDISNPWQPEELGYYLPEPGQGYQVAQSNDVFATPDGLYDLVDRLGGFDILKWIGA